MVAEGGVESLVGSDLNVSYDRLELTEDLILVNLVHHGPLSSVPTPQHQLSSWQKNIFFNLYAWRA